MAPTFSLERLGTETAGLELAAGLCAYSRFAHPNSIPNRKTAKCVGFIVAVSQEGADFPPSLYLDTAASSLVQTRLSSFQSPFHNFRESDKPPLKRILPLDPSSLFLCCSGRLTSNAETDPLPARLVLLLPA